MQHVLYWWDKSGVTWFLRGKQLIKAANALFIDLELFSKLKGFGFGDNSINLFTSYLSDKFQAVSLITSHRVPW